MSIDAFPLFGKLVTYVLANMSSIMPKWTYSAPTKVTIGTGTTVVLAANTDRKYAVIVNDSENVIYLAIGHDAVMNQGIRLNASGGSFEMTAVNLSTQAINAIGSSSDNVTVQEAE